MQGKEFLMASRGFKQIMFLGDLKHFVIFKTGPVY